MNKNQELERRIQPIADALGVGFYGEDGKLHMETWNQIGVLFPQSSLLSLEKAYRIHSHINEDLALIVFRLTGNMYVFVYYSLKADRVFLYIVDGDLLRKIVNRLSSTMTDIDLDKFIKKFKNSLSLEEGLGDARRVTFARYCHSGSKLWAKFENARRENQ